MHDQQRLTTCERSNALNLRRSSQKRELCIKNFDRLARLSEGERAEFLENAAKWKAMSKSERDAWRRLLLPPFPPLPPIPSDPLAHQN